METSSAGSTASVIGREIARLVLPSVCVVCGQDLPWADRVASCCRRCWDSHSKIVESKCDRCGVPWHSDVRTARFTCLECQIDPPDLEWIDSWGHYRGSLARVLHAFKFSGHDFLGDSLGDLMVEAWNSRSEPRFDCVTFVPLHPRRRRARGYDQAERLARRFARQTSMRLENRLLSRRLDREAQSRLDRVHRLTNVRGAFDASARCGGKAVLLVDDICTTGATMRACAEALLSAGAERVAGITVARA